MPPRCTEPVSLGLNGSLTSYCRNSPVPQQETYRKRSSRLRLMSVTSGGTALNGFSAGGSWSGSAGSGGTPITLGTPPRAPARDQGQIDDGKALSGKPNPPNP